MIKETKDQIEVEEENLMFNKVSSDQKQLGIFAI